MPQIQAGCFSSFFKPRRHESSPETHRGRRSHLQGKLSGYPQTSEESENPELLCSHFNPSCDFSYGEKSEWWSSMDQPPSYMQRDTQGVFRPEVMATIENKLHEIDPELRKLSLQIHDHPELMFKEKFAHDLLTTFMSEYGFSVTKHYLGLDTAWRAEFKHRMGKGSRVLGINSEMDALKGIGHACGHNLIAISGVGVAIAVKAALEAHNVPGKIVLLGTPAEEGGGGKVILLERGGYKDMDACIMCHPGPGPVHSVSTGPSIAMQSIEVEYFGHAAHAGAAPWEGTNALDAAFLAYSGISVLRQQTKPDHRVHGVIGGKNWSPNVIPDYANMRWAIRAPTYGELSPFGDRVKACFEAAALATACKVNIKFGLPYYDLRQNNILAGEFTDIIAQRYGMVSNSIGTSASTDFGNVTYALPAFHPLFAIPTSPNGGNHTPEFAKASRTMEAHVATMIVTKGLALTGFRVLDDDVFFESVKGEFDAWQSHKQ